MFRLIEIFGKYIGVDYTSCLLLLIIEQSSQNRSHSLIIVLNIHLIKAS